MNDQKEFVIALAGNPNTGKSTVFNNLTGLKQHTGNWSGKTVVNAQGNFKVNNIKFKIYDLPGIYSMFSSSAEEKAAKDFICLEKPDITIVVLDATCLERNLNLALQIMEMTKNVIVCINLMDEAEKKNIFIDINKLSLLTGVPIIPTNARQGKGMDILKTALMDCVCGNIAINPIETIYSNELEEAVSLVYNKSKHLLPKGYSPHWLAGAIIEEDTWFYKDFADKTGLNNLELMELHAYGEQATEFLQSNGIDINDFKLQKTMSFLKRAEFLGSEVVTLKDKNYDYKDRFFDKIVLSKTFGIPIMLFILALIFWITIVGANYPSQMLMKAFNIMKGGISNFLISINSPSVVYGIVIDGIFTTVSWVVAVMLPPMAIFFPMFTFLEDIGLLPRIAFNLDGLFRKANAHGKQALTMAMGFGCNAAAITSCRIIETPRERLIAILTNNFVPCNGRFPTLIMLAVIFFGGTVGGALTSGFFVLLMIILSVFITLMVSKFLSGTVLKGLQSSFTLELPPYRKPQIGKIIIHSLVDRTIFVLGRAVSVAIPAGAMIWVLQNTYVGDLTVINYCANILNPFAQAIGMDGFILMAFILGLPANEIVIPILLMCYIGSGSMVNIESSFEIGKILTANGWTWVTALCTVLFSLNHFPCATTLLTIKKETGSIKWTVVSAVLPTLVGILICFIVSQTFAIFGVL